jgi:hypothetical protein
MFNGYFFPRRKKAIGNTIYEIMLDKSSADSSISTDQSKLSVAHRKIEANKMEIRSGVRFSIFLFLTK